MSCHARGSREDTAFSSWGAQRRRRRLSPIPLGCSRGRAPHSWFFLVPEGLGPGQAGRRARSLGMGSALAALSTGSWHGELPWLPDSSLARGMTPCEFGGFFPPLNFLMIHFWHVAQGSGAAGMLIFISRVSFCGISSGCSINPGSGAGTGAGGHCPFPAGADARGGCGGRPFAAWQQGQMSLCCLAWA